MKNFLYVLAVIAITWLAKLSYDVQHLNTQLAENQRTIRKSEQTIAYLNDQLAALHRKSLTATTAESTKPNQQPLAATEVIGLNPIVLIQQKLQLIGFAVQQQKYVYAVEQLNELDQFVEKNDLAENLKRTLHSTISQDKDLIEQYVATRAVREEQLADALQTIQQSLHKESDYTEIKVSQDQQKSWLSQWLKFDRVEQNTPHVVNRKFILKQVELRIILAQQALARGALLDYQQMLDLMIAELDQLPDGYSEQLKQKLLKLKRTKLSAIPKLTSLSILGA